MSRPASDRAEPVVGQPPTPLSVAIVLPTLDGGGAERMMLNLATGLRALGADTDLVVISPKGNLSRQLPDEQFVSLNCARTRDAFFALRRYMVSTSPDVLLSTLTHANILAIVAVRTLPRRPKIVVREATSVRSASSGHRVRWQGALLSAAMRATYPRADAVVAGSKGALAELLQIVRLAPAKVAVIPNPVWGEQQAEAAATPLNHPWFSGAGLPPVIAVGRLNPAKNYPFLLSAMVVARRARPDLRLVILGEGSEGPALEALATKLGLGDAVRFEGFVPNPFPFMSRASALILSSAWEGSPNVIPEALACGCPVVATDCPSGPREILENGRYGTLVPCNDAEALAQAILEVLDTRPDRERLRRRGSDYSVAGSSEAYLNLFNRLFAGAA